MDYVVLLHGIGRGAHVMAPLAKKLRSDYTVYVDDYRSVHHRIEHLIEHVYARIQKACPDKTKTMHFVCYSMGGIILRGIVQRYKPSNLGRVVMIGTPNRGAHFVDFLKPFRLYQKIYGPAGQQLGTDEESFMHQLLPINFELGVIAGDNIWDLPFPLGIFVLKRPHDGKVTVENTKVKGMQDHMIVHSNHTFLPKNKDVLLQVPYFLKSGKFFRE